MCLFVALFNPVSNEHVCFALLFRVAIRRKHQFLSIRRKHWKPVKLGAESDAFQARAIDIDLVQIEVSSARVVDVRSKDYSFAVREKVRSEVRFTIARHLSFVRTIGIHHPDFEH